MKIKIHRGAAQIGGSCVELTAAGHRLIIDVGLPLDADDPESDEILPHAEGLFTDSQQCLPILGILISHPHQDHFAKLPHASNEFAQLQVWYPWALSRLVADRSGKDLLYKFKPWKMERQDIHDNPEKFVLLVKPSYWKDVEKMDLQGSTYLYSQWSGYATKARENEFRRMLERNRFSLQHLHTSGHATRDDLRSFVRAIKPKILIPMHTEHPEEYETFGGMSRIMHDGMVLEL